MYFKFETGREFFSTGVMAADLRSSGTKAKYIEELTIRVIVGVNVALHLFKSHVGIGSNEQLFFGDFCINLATSSPKVSLKGVGAT